MPVTNYISVNGRMLSEITDGVILDYVPDALGSIHSVVDQTATAVKTMRYKPYGEVLSRSGSISDRMYQWVGTYGYRATFNYASSHYVRARHYSQTPGTWTTVDPLWPDERAYGYVSGRAAVFNDPFGTAPCAGPSCCCQATALFAGWPRTLNGDPSVLDPKGSPGPRYGHVITLFGRTTALDSKVAGGDCTLKWYECSNFQLTPNHKPGTWLNRSSDILRAAGFEQWRRRQFDCDKNRNWSGFLRDEPSLTERRGKVPGGRLLYIRVILKSGKGDCKGQVVADFTQQILFQNGKWTLILLNRLEPSTICSNPPNE